MYDYINFEMADPKGIPIASDTLAVQYLKRRVEHCTLLGLPLEHWEYEALTSVGL